MSVLNRVGIQRAKNGFVVQGINDYANFTGEPEIFATFGEAVAKQSELLGETEFARTICQSQALSQSLSEFVAVSVAPKLLAIEAKVNPGIENVVGDDLDL